MKIVLSIDADHDNKPLSLRATKSVDKTTSRPRTALTVTTEQLYGWEFNIKNTWFGRQLFSGATASSELRRRTIAW